MVVRTYMELGSRWVDRKGKEPCAGGALAGKKVVFIVDDREMKSECLMLPYLFEKAGASEESCPIAYSVLLNWPSSISADAIMLRSSRMFSDPGERRNELIAALKALRAVNPDAAILVGAIGYGRSLAGLLTDDPAHPTINALDIESKCDDPAALRKLGEILKARHKE